VIDVGGARHQLVVVRVVPIGQARAVLGSRDNDFEPAAVGENDLREPGVRAVGRVFEKCRGGRFAN
jgi:hypothetical protein